MCNRLALLRRRKKHIVASPCTHLFVLLRNTGKLAFVTFGIPLLDLRGAIDVISLHLLNTTQERDRDRDTDRDIDRDRDRDRDERQKTKTKDKK